MYEFSISLTGDKIDATAFVEAVANAVKLLRSVAHGDRVAWRLATLRYSSPATIGFTGEPKRKPRDAPRYQPEEIGRALMAGFQSLEDGMAPHGFTDRSLELAKKIAGLKGHGGIDTVIFTSVNGSGPTSLHITTRTIATIDDAIGAKYLSLGEIEGRLEVVSSHRVFSCNVYDKLLGNAVHCNVPVSLKEKVLKHFDQDVIASGVVGRDGSGRARNIDLDEIRPVPIPENPPHSLAGMAPDFTDGVESAEYIKRRWM